MEAASFGDDISRSDQIMGIRPCRSLVESLDFESRMPFHGLATLSEGRHAVENGGMSHPSPGATGMKIGSVESLDSPLPYRPKSYSRTFYFSIVTKVIVC